MSVWLGRVVSLGCIICGMPANAHHIRFGQGMAMRARDALAIPLCPIHHQSGGLGVAFHAGPKSFERNFGTELELLELTYQRLNEPFPPKELVELLERQHVGSLIAWHR